MIDKIGPFIFDNQYIIFCSHKVRKFIYFLLYLIENQCADICLTSRCSFREVFSSKSNILHLTRIFGCVMKHEEH